MSGMQRINAIFQLVRMGSAVSKRPVRDIPITIRPLHGGLADAQGFKHYLVIIGDGGLKPVVRVMYDASKSGGTEIHRFKVVHEKPYP